MIRRGALALLGACSVGILVSTVVGGPVGEVVFSFLAVVFPVALMLLGIVKGGRLGSAVWPVAALLTVLTLSVAGMLLLRGGVDATPRLFGLPAAAVIQMTGLFLVPLVLVALGFARTFASFNPSRDELDELRAAARRRAAR